MDVKKLVAKCYNAVAQFFIDKMEQEYESRYNKLAEQITPKIIALYEEVLASAGPDKKAVPADLFHLDSYWTLQKELKQELNNFGTELIVFSWKAFGYMFLNVYESILIDGKNATCTIKHRAIGKIIAKPWHERTWMERTWINLSYLYDGLFKTLMTCVISNCKTDKLEALLQEEFETSRKGINTIINTHSTVIQTHALASRYRHAKKIAAMEVMKNE